MTIYFDENIPKHLAEGFALIQKYEGVKIGIKVEVKYIPTVFQKGIKDPEWLPKLSKNKSFVITQDVNISRRKHEVELYKQYGIGLFLLKGKNSKHGMSVWEMVEIMAKHWQKILDIIISQKPPYVYEIKLNRKPIKLS